MHDIAWLHWVYCGKPDSGNTEELISNPIHLSNSNDWESGQQKAPLNGKTGDAKDLEGMPILYQAKVQTDFRSYCQLQDHGGFEQDQQRAGI